MIGGGTYAMVSFCSSASNELYGGRSIRLKEGCLFGSWSISPAFWIVKRLGPSDPGRFLNPLTGSRYVPVDEK
jgi:hypothetical protein